MGKRFFILIFNCINYIGINNNYYFTKMSENQDISQKESSIQNQQLQQKQEQQPLQNNDMIIDNKNFSKNLKTNDPLAIARDDLQTYVNFLKNKGIDITDLDCPEDFIKNLRAKQKKVRELNQSRIEWAKHLKSTGIDLNNNKLLEMATSNHLPQNQEEEYFNCFVAANEKLFEKKQNEINEEKKKNESLQKQINDLNDINKKRKIDQIEYKEEIEEESKKKVKPNPEKNNNNGSQVITFRTVSNPEQIKDQRSCGQWLKNLVDTYNYVPKFKVSNEEDIKYHEKIINCDIGKNNTFPANFKGLPFTQ